jgi:hypothetical protein
MMGAGIILSIAGKLGFGKLSEKAAGLIGLLIMIAVVVGAFFAILDAYGDAKFREGENHADAKWQQASEELEEDAEQSAERADEDSAERTAEYNQRLAEERERLDEAEAHGSSPLDVIFGTSELPHGEDR